MPASCRRTRRCCRRARCRSPASKHERAEAEVAQHRRRPGADLRRRQPGRPLAAALPGSAASRMSSPFEQLAGERSPGVDGDGRRRVEDVGRQRPAPRRRRAPRAARRSSSGSSSARPSSRTGGRATVIGPSTAAAGGGDRRRARCAAVGDLVGGRVGPGSGAPATMATFIGSAAGASTGRRSRNVSCSATTSPSTRTSTVIGYRPGSAQDERVGGVGVDGRRHVDRAASSPRRRVASAGASGSDDGVDDAAAASPSSTSASSPGRRPGGGRRRAARPSALGRRGGRRRPAGGVGDAWSSWWSSSWSWDDVDERAGRASNSARHDWPGSTANVWPVEHQRRRRRRPGRRRRGPARTATQRDRREAGERGSDAATAGSSIGGSVELHDEELVGEPPEAERLVQAERRGVVDGGVDEAVAQPARAHPRQRVERRGPARGPGPAAAGTTASRCR